MSNYISENTKRIAVIASIAILIFVYAKRCADRDEVLNNYEFTEGKIERYYTIGVTSYYLEYSYFVRDMKYTRTINSRAFKECVNNFEICEPKRFWVAYSRNHYSKSLINLSYEIQNIKKPDIPTSLDNFY